MIVSFSAQAILDAHETIDKKSEEIEKKIMSSDLGQKIAQTFGDSTQYGPVEGKAIDKESLGLAIREETPSERRMRKIRENPFFGPFVRSAEEAAEVLNERVEAAGDRVFGESEYSLAIAEIRREDPKFNVQRFVDKLEKETIPTVLKAFLENDLKTLSVGICCSVVRCVVGAMQM
jgi:hypothetical protein